MTLDSLHILLTYRCTKRCPHCFVWGAPEAEGVFSLDALTRVMEDARSLGSIKWLYFEGGEPFLYYALLLEAVRRGTALGFSTGAVTNAYWATGQDEARIWLDPLAAAGLGDLRASADSWHGSPAKAHLAVEGALRLGLVAGTVAVDGGDTSSSRRKGDPINGGQVLHRGRAAVRLAPGKVGRPWQAYTECPYEELEHPRRLHLDPFGHLHLCQGLTIGNLGQNSFASIASQYRPENYPVIALLRSGGPAALVREFSLPLAGNFADACHLCYAARCRLRETFPEELAPAQVYGL